MTGSESRFAVRLTPRAGDDHVDGVIEGELRARVTAPGDVRIVAGASSRRKLVVVDGLEPDQIVARWPGLRV